MIHPGGTRSNAERGGLAQQQAFGSALDRDRVMRGVDLHLPQPPRSSAVNAGIPLLCWPLNSADMGLRHPSVRRRHALRFKLCIPKHLLHTSATSMSIACILPAMLKLVKFVQWSAMICTEMFVIWRTSPTLSSRSEAPAPLTTACTPMSDTWGDRNHTLGHTALESPHARHTVSWGKSAAAMN